MTSDLLPLPIRSWQPHVAAGPCGWIVAGESEDGITLALVVPPVTTR